MRDAFDIIKNVRITEKGATLAEKHNQYVVRVVKDATKQEIKYAVKTIFGKTALRVNTMQVRGKLRRERSANFGKRPDWKKAIVTLKEGEKIELV
jgi:large subunit ribosomal protein L23